MHHLYHVKNTRRENYRTVTLALDQPLNAEPGQFVMVWLPSVGEKPYSVTSGNPLTLTVVNVGVFSAALCALEHGDKLWIRGPFGHGFQLQGQTLMLVGGGYGVAPLYFLSQQAVSQGCQVAVCIGAASAQDVLLRETLEDAGCSVRITTEDGSLGDTGFVTELVNDLIPDIKPDWLYACGPPGMLQAVSSLCIVHKLSHQLSWEAHIRCGLGVCGHCECEGIHTSLPAGWLVCQDGPVQIVEYTQDLDH